MTHSYRFADASIIAAFDYVSMIWAATFGYAFFSETPSAAVLAGAAVVAGAGVLVLWRERSRRARPPSRRAGRDRRSALRRANAGRNPFYIPYAARL